MLGGARTGMRAVILSVREAPVSGAARWSEGCGAHGPGWDYACACQTCALGDEERGAGRVLVRGVRTMVW
jgi:hypothetical protein